MASARKAPRIKGFFIVLPPALFSIKVSNTLMRQKLLSICASQLYTRGWVIIGRAQEISYGYLAQTDDLGHCGIGPVFRGRLGAGWGLVREQHRSGRNPAGRSSPGAGAAARPPGGTQP